MSCQNGLRMLHALCGRQVVRQEAKQMRKKKGKFPHFVNFATHYEGTDAVINMRKGREQQLGWITDLDPRHPVCHLNSDNQDCQLFSHILGSEKVSERNPSRLPAF